MSRLSPGSIDTVRTDCEDQMPEEHTPTEAEMAVDPFTAVQLGRSDRASLLGKVRRRCGAAEHLSFPGNSVTQTCVGTVYAVASISSPTS